MSGSRSCSDSNNSLMGLFYVMQTVAVKIGLLPPHVVFRASAPGSIEIHVNLLGAHHLDIRATNPLDPPSVVECRTKQKAAITRWIEEWKASPPLPIA